MQVAPELELAKWRCAVDATCDRAGLILCGDLEVASQIIADPGSSAGGQRAAVRAQDRLKELLLYAVSEDYFAVRKQLGIAITA